MSKTIGQRIKELRDQRGLTQAELAKQLGCAQNTVAEWEKRVGRTPGKKLLGRVAQSLGISIDYLLGEADMAKPQLPCYGEIASQEFVWPNLEQPYSYVDIPQKECSPGRFCFKILDDLLEPIICKGDYGIFEKRLPEDGDIVVARFPEEHNKTVIRMWRQQGNEVMLTEANVHRIATPYFFEWLSVDKETGVFTIKKRPLQNVIVEGKLIVVKRVLKSVQFYSKVNYVFS